MNINIQKNGSDEWHNIIICLCENFNCEMTISTLRPEQNGRHFEKKMFPVKNFFLFWLKCHGIFLRCVCVWTGTWPLIAWMTTQLTDEKMYYDVIKSKQFPHYWPFVRGIHRSPVNSLHKGQWCGALMFFFIYAWMNTWVNNREAGDLRHYRVHYDVTIMEYMHPEASLYQDDGISLSHLP